MMQAGQVFIFFLGPMIVGHPLSDRTFDCGVQLHLLPEEIRIEYELTVTELTVARELLTLSEPGQLPARALEQIELYGDILLPILARGLVLSVNGQKIPLETIEERTEIAREDHVRFRFQLRARIPANTETMSLDFIDTNFSGERGYHRIGLRVGPGVKSIRSSALPLLQDVPLVPNWEMTPEQEAASTRVEMSYRVAPQERTASRTPVPSDTKVLGETNETVPHLSSVRQTTPKTNQVDSPFDRKLRDLLSEEPSRPWFWGMLLIAYLLGTIHALKPGHGKTLVAAYLVGERGTLLHAVILGLVTTLTHTGTVLLVALLLGPLSGSDWANEGLLGFWLTLLSGVLITSFGATLLWRRCHGSGDLLHRHGPWGHVHLPDRTIQRMDEGNSKGHSHDHSHHHGHTHESGQPGDPPRLGSLLTLGFSGGLIPCDDAVLLLVAAIGAGLLAQAFLVLLAFSAGLASVLVMLGVLVVKIRGIATWGRQPGRWLHALQIFSALAITIIGLTLCWKAFPFPFR